jgi:chromosome segregation ATPase
MVDEIYLQNAVRIRRTYLKLSNNMELYQKKAQEVSDKLEATISKIDDLQHQVEESRNDKSGKKDSNQFLMELVKILNEVEEDGKALESSVDPLNKEIEKLALEEQELYRQIKEKHFDLTDEQIVTSVQNRLIKENLQ